MIIGRLEEIDQINQALNDNESQFVAIYGRRRVGKTFLVRSVLADKFTFQHSGLANAKTKEQLEAFRLAIIGHGYKDCPVLTSWLEAFEMLKEVVRKSKKRRKVIFIDEISWMDTARSNFLSAFEHFWNSWASARNDIVLIICASASSWIVNNVFHNRGGLHNRVTCQIRLNPFTLKECEDYCKYKGLTLSRKQILSLYMSIGGVAYYWSLLKKGLSADQNINRLFFAESGQLRGEFDDLFASLYKKPNAYVNVIRTLGTVNSGMTRPEIARACNIINNGGFGRILDELTQCGFIRSFNIPGKKKKDAIIQLSDCYLFFYLKCVEGNQDNSTYWIDNILSPLHSTWSGLAFERVCFAHIPQIKHALGIYGVATNCYSWKYVSNTPDEDGAQIDLLLARKDGITNICEIKWSKGKYVLDRNDIENITNKVNAYAKHSGSSNALHITMITSDGLKQNMYYNEIQSEICADELFL